LFNLQKRSQASSFGAQLAAAESSSLSESVSAIEVDEVFFLPAEPPLKLIPGTERPPSADEPLADPPLDCMPGTLRPPFIFLDFPEALPPFILIPGTERPPLDPDLPLALPPFLDIPGTFNPPFVEPLPPKALPPFLDIPGTLSPPELAPLEPRPLLDAPGNYLTPKLLAVLAVAATAPVYLVLLCFDTNLTSSTKFIREP